MLIKENLLPVWYTTSLTMLTKRPESPFYGDNHPFPSDINPLNKSQLEKAAFSFAGANFLQPQEWGSACRLARGWNNKILNDQEAQVILRIASIRGHLGEMVRVAHWIPLLKDLSANEITILTDLPQLFTHHLTVNINEESLLRGKCYILEPQYSAYIFTPTEVDDRDRDVEFQSVSNAAFHLTFTPQSVSHLNILQQMQVYAYMFFGCTGRPHR